MLRGFDVLVQLVIAAMITAPSGIAPGVVVTGRARPRSVRVEVGIRWCGFAGPAIVRTTEPRSNSSSRS
jgi:hypothetical protein